MEGANDQRNSGSHGFMHSLKYPGVTNKVNLPQTAAVFRPQTYGAGCPDVHEPVTELGVEWHPAHAKVHDLPDKGQDFESIQQQPIDKKEE